MGLIEALSAFPKLQTIECCEGEVNKPRGSDPAWVCFVYGDPLGNPRRELAEFVLEFLGPRLAEELGDRVSLCLRVTSWGDARGELAVPPGVYPKLVSALRRLARGAVSSASRTTGCSCGRSHT